MVATSQPLASEAGASLLRAGGNAIDAALAAAAVLAVTDPISCGLGGDGFALVFDSDRQAVTALNGSGRSPAALSLDRLQADGLTCLPVTHAHTVTVPGACSSWCALAQRFGSLPLATIFAPAIALADAGFPVAPITAHGWAREADRVLRTAPGGHRLLLAGRAPYAGELIRNQELADVLRAVAQGGVQAFYQGWIAEQIVTTVTNCGGLLTLDDMAAHRANWDPPVSTTYRNLNIWECPPTGPGMVALLALGILRQLPIPEDPVARVHLVIEALRFAFADAGRYVADPAMAEFSTIELLRDEHAAAQAKRIDPTRASVPPHTSVPGTCSDTVYLTAVDDGGSACSLSFGNYLGVGTGIVPDGLGFPLHNRGAGFSLEPTHPNCLAGGKRPYHTSIPALATRADGSLHASFGVMGEAMQPQGQVQLLLAMLADNTDPQHALDQPRLCLEPDGVALEPEFDPALLEGLLALGHRVRTVPSHDRALFGRGQIITRDAESGVLCGGSDPRADGCAIGL